MSEYIVHIEDIKTLYGNTDFPFPLDAYMREKIVRCRDCQHYKETDGLSHFNMAFCKFHSGPCEPVGYCAWGERKEGE